MLMVISPAKTLDFETKAKIKTFTTPDFLEQSQQLIDQLRLLSPADIADLMSISEKLSVLNADRYLQWHYPFTPTNAKQAILAFKGDVYTGLDAQTFSADDFKFSQQHLRILSGLYGLLRPLDLIQAYRLEMGTKFATKIGNNLYEFWGEKLTDALNAQLKKSKTSILLNLASNEYFKAVKTSKIHADIITPVFKDMTKGKYKVVSFYAKKARGLMVAYIIKKRLTEVDDIKRFNSEDYTYSAAQSSAREWVFIRG